MSAGVDFESLRSESAYSKFKVQMPFGERASRPVAFGKDNSDAPMDTADRFQPDLVLRLQQRKEAE